MQSQMTKKFLLAVLFAALAIASAKSYSFKLFQPAMMGEKELKAGEYQVEVVDQKAIIRSGKSQSEAPVEVETGDTKYSSTTVRFSNGDGKMHIQEIHIGGTHTKLVF